MKNNYCLYIHTTPNGKKYVGITCQPFLKRWKNGGGYINNKHFYLAIKKYGWENITHEIIKDGLSKEEACNLEKEYISKFKTCDREYGYNNSIGGENSFKGCHHTEETKKIIAKYTHLHYTDKMRNALIETNHKKRKKVYSYDINGNFLKEYNSIIEAEKDTGVDNSNIVACCKGKYSQFKGYMFSYDKKEMPANRRKRKQVSMYSLDGNYIKTFKSIKDASGEIKIATHIIDCCKGKYSQSGGYIWKYE